MGPLPESCAVIKHIVRATDGKVKAGQLFFKRNFNIMLVASTPRSPV